MELGKCSKCKTSFFASGHNNLVTRTNSDWESRCFLRESMFWHCLQSFSNSPRTRSSLKQCENQKKGGDLPLTITHKLNKTGKDRCLIQSQYKPKCSSKLQKYSYSYVFITTVWFWSLDPVQVCLGQLKSGPERGTGRSRGWCEDNTKGALRKKIKLN